MLSCVPCVRGRWAGVGRGGKGELWVGVSGKGGGLANLAEAPLASSLAGPLAAPRGEAVDLLALGPASSDVPESAIAVVCLMKGAPPSRISSRSNCQYALRVTGTVCSGPS